MSISAILSKITPFLSSALEPALGGVFHKYGTVAKTAVRSAITRSDNGLNDLVTVYRHYDENHPLVQTAISEAQSLLKLAGLNAPDADGLAAHIRAAIHDLASAFVPLDDKTATSAQPDQSAAS